MIQLSSFGGKRVCAKFSKLNYNNIKFLDLDDECPDGYKVCETSTRKDKLNFVCIPEEVKASCPVRDMHLIHKSEQGQTNFTYIDFDADYRIGYSTVVDELPLSQFRVQQNRPCRDHAFQSQTSSQFNDSYLNDMVLRGDSVSMGCPYYKEGENVFSEKYRKLFIGSQSPQFTVHEAEE